MDSVRPALGAQPVVDVAYTALDLRRRSSSLDGFWLADNDESEPLGIDQFARKLCNIISRHRLDIACTSLDIVDAKIMVLDRHQHTRDAVGRAEAKWKGACEV